MSQVRWCDKCCTVFPTNGSGEVGGQVTRTVRDASGKISSYAESVDYCAACSLPATDVRAITAELNTSKGLASNP